MSAASPLLVDFGWKAPDFHLADTRGKVWTLADVRGPQGALVLRVAAAREAESPGSGRRNSSGS